MNYLDKAAVISDCNKYRYALFRKWEESKPTILFIGLNPSTADAEKDDPTIRRLVNFSNAWGFGALCIVNIFAFRATDPKVMIQATDPIGPLNDKTIQHFASLSGYRVAMWGAHGIFKNRAKQVARLVGELHCFKVNSDGSPAHPLYLPKSTVPICYEVK